ncbi:PREDICTED: dynactin subunit 4-like [Rhagoletis zephyria]|uniref:dynactin subunit 4-like n=1 Tax=Rhagoletis zephyria TaxID=28612 RepID=UPI0008119940|nr:PREDICTED: dynactin subunit 4-like [Rhagoletis zephyria]
MARSSSGMSLSDKSFPELEGFKPATAFGEEEIEKMEKLNLQDYYGDLSTDAEEEIEVSNKNSLKQIIQQIENQPVECKDLFPTSQMLVVKRSLRCKTCEHNLSKPEYNPSLVKFKIQLSAYYHIPELRILKLPSLKMGNTTRVELTITNPTQYLLNVTLLPVDIHLNATADLVLPNTVLQLTPKDDTGDIVDFDSSASKFNDDPNVISLRQGNKLGIYLFVTPTKGEVDCVVEFRMKHDYVYTIPTPLNPQHEFGDKQQPSKEVKWITHSIRVNLGNISL